MCEPAEIDPSALDDDALAALVVDLEEQQARLEATRLKVLGEWDARAVWAADGAHNGASWLAARGWTSRSSASAFLRDARQLRHMPETAAAVDEFRLAPPKGRLLARAVNDRTREAFARDEHLLVDVLKGLTVDDAAHAIRFWQRMADEDGPEPRDRDHNSFWLSQSHNGRWQIKGDLDQESGTVLWGELSARTDELARARRADNQPQAGMGPQLRAEALVEMARRSTAATDGTACARPLLWVITNKDQLETGNGVAELVGGGSISAKIAQRLACDGDLAELLIDPEGNQVNLGRTQRLATATQRRLLTIRDGGCIFPGCTMPPDWCQVHHLKPWQDGGNTDLKDLGWVCCHHHHLLHEGGWSVERLPDGELAFARPDGTRLEPPVIVT